MTESISTSVTELSIPSSSSVIEFETLLNILSTQECNYDRNKILKSLIDNVSYITINNIETCLGLYDTDHEKNECLVILYPKIKTIDPLNICTLLKSFATDNGKNLAIDILITKFETIDSIKFTNIISNIISNFDTDHGKNVSLQTLVSKFTNVSNNELENILDNFDVDYSKNTVIDILYSKINIDIYDILSVSSKFDTEYGKISMIERMSGHLMSSDKKMPLLIFWSQLGGMNNTKKFGVIQQNINSLDLEYSNSQEFCETLTKMCDDVNILRSLCILCNIKEVDYNPIIDKLAKNLSSIIINGVHHNINEFKIGKDYTFEHIDDEDGSMTNICIKRSSEDLGNVSIKTIHKNGRVSSCTSTVTFKQGLVIEKNNICY